MKISLSYKSSFLFPLLPVLLAWWWSVLAPVLTPELAGWSRVWPQALVLLLQFLPLLLCQAVGGWLQQQTAPKRMVIAAVGLFWVLGMLAYPAFFLFADSSGWLKFGENEWLLALMLSLLYWLHCWYQHKLQQGNRSRWQWLWSLDTVLLLLLLMWTISFALFLVSHPAGMAEQPIPTKVDLVRLGSNPWLFLHYLWQISLLAGVMFGSYWLNRYWLIRRVLAQHGLLPFALVSLFFILLSYPLISTLLLLLPMNQVLAPAIPAGSHNPFNWYNLNFMLLQWLLTTPLILAFDRQQQESTLAKIQHQQVHTELQLLQQQINPHFLFNTLNNLYALCLMKSDDAPKLILQLADLLRYVVYQGQQPRVTLQQELDYLQHYLALQQLRVSNKTTLTVDFPVDSSGYQLPPLLLMMLVENAYKHGVEMSNAPSHVEVSAAVRDHTLYFSCRNSTSVAEAAAPGGGIGLENLRRRLQLYYGDDYRLHSAPAGNEWLAELTLKLELV
ncbi:MAG: sensor histidine kinase [Gammaproteobacteria bacterium]|nr:sensor histidine kinase [Gammaproteobacteria bacterium]